MKPDMEPCPRCKSSDHVRRKLITFPDLITPRLQSPHFLVSAPTTPELHYFTHASFVEGLFCDTCQTAFVPQSFLLELGLDEIDECWHLLPKYP